MGRIEVQAVNAKPGLSGKKTKRRKVLISLLLCAGLIVAGIYILPYGLVGEKEALPIAWTHPEAAGEDEVFSSAEVPSLKVMTLNLAHGRGDGPHPILQSKKALQSNLDMAVEILLREKPFAAALQEADAPSLWSGDFSHSQYLAERGGFLHSFHGEHVKGMGLSYGTALLCRAPLEDTRSITFAPSPPTWSKGFVTGTLKWPGKPDFLVDLVSIHLDFSRASVRARQAEELVAHFCPRTKPLIMMGDFNCEWKGHEATVRKVAEKLGLEAFQPESADGITFPFSGSRLDWILISSELEFVSYRVLPDILSDHLAVVAEIKKRY